MPGPVFLETDSLSLRPASQEDISFLRENEQDPRIRATRSLYKPVDEEWARQRIGGRMGREDSSLGLLVCVDETPVGFVYLIREQPGDRITRRGELAYWVTPSEWGNGYATSASRLILDHAFTQLGLHRIEASVVASNHASRRVLEKLGFQEEGTARAAARIEGAWMDRLRFGLLESEWDT